MSSRVWSRPDRPGRSIPQRSQHMQRTDAKLLTRNSVSLNISQTNRSRPSAYALSSSSSLTNGGGRRAHQIPTFPAKVVPPASGLKSQTSSWAVSTRLHTRKSSCEVGGGSSEVRARAGRSKLGREVIWVDAALREQVRGR